MSQFQASATLTAALLAHKGAAAPSGAVSALLNGPSLTAPRAEPEVRVARDAKPKPASRDRIKLSLRLDRNAHLRLKLAAAHLRLSSQAILATALDEFLSRAAPEIMGGDCACLVASNGD